MYRVQLTTSYFPAIADGAVDHISIGEALARAAEDAADLVALKEINIAGEMGRSWTFRQLYDEARLLAYALLSRHEPGARIAIWAPNIPEWVLLEYASALAGLTIITVNPSFQARELKYVLEQSCASALYFVQTYRGNPMGVISEEVCERIPSIRHLIDMDDRNALFSGAEIERRLPTVDPMDPAQIQYTSGTTGFPKGAVLHHKGLYVNAKLATARYCVQRGDVWLNFMPLFHTGGCGLTALGSLSTRSTMILAALFDPHTMNRIIEAEKVTHFLAVPTMITALIEAQAVVLRNLTSVKSIVAGGSMVPGELVRKAQAIFKSNFQIVYGQTETSPVLTLVWPDDSLSDILGTVGQAIPHTEISIRSPATNEVLPIGEVGEICARGYMTMLEYNDNPQATRETIDAENWLHTGDLGAMDVRGYVRVTGRVKDMIIRGGENLFPAEIEGTMLEHPLLSEVAVIGVPDTKFGEVVACFMRGIGRERLTRPELVTFCRKHLSPQKTPVVWIYLDEWPLTASGKIQKFVLREMYVAGKFDDRALG